MKPAIFFALFTCILSLGCDRRYIPTGGVVTEKGETIIGGDNTSHLTVTIRHLTVTIRWCSPEGRCSTGTWQSSFEDYNKATIGSWYGDNPAKMVETQQPKDDQHSVHLVLQTLPVVAAVLASLAMSKILIVVMKAYDRRRKRKEASLPRATIAKD